MTLKYEEEIIDAFFDQVVEETSKTAIYPERYALDYLFTGFASEAGEVAGEYAKYIRKGKRLCDYEEFRKNLVLELGDSLWFIFEICRQFKMDPAVIIEKNLEKLQKRKEEGTIIER